MHSRFHSRTLHLTAGEWRGRKPAVTQSWENECYQSWYSAFPRILWFLRMKPALSSLSRSKKQYFYRKLNIWTALRPPTFKNPLLKVKRWVGEGGLGDRQQQEEIKVFSILIQKLLQAIPEPHVLAPSLNPPPQLPCHHCWNKSQHIVLSQKLKLWPSYSSPPRTSNSWGKTVSAPL